MYWIRLDDVEVDSDTSYNRDSNRQLESLTLNCDAHSSAYSVSEDDDEEVELEDHMLRPIYEMLT